MRFSKRDKEQLGMDTIYEVYRYETFRNVRHIRDKVCTNREGKKYLTRVMKRLREPEDNG